MIHYDRTQVSAIPGLVMAAGVGAIYLGCRGFLAQGIVVWRRSGNETRLTGWPGRALGFFLILTGGMLIWLSLAMATVWKERVS